MNTIREEVVAKAKDAAKKVFETRECMIHSDKFLRSLRNGDVIKGKTVQDFHTTKKAIKYSEELRDSHREQFIEYSKEHENLENYYKYILKQNKAISKKYKPQNKIVKRRFVK